jgi:UDP-4-amino-4,6-dideoxy-N-acetyl-beta-L-altrosamine N-acetyltransferase
MNDFNQVELKDINETDLKKILDWRNQDSIRNVMNSSKIISMVEHLQWFERLQKDETAISKIFYYNHVPYGVVNISQIDQINKKCEWGFYIGEKNSPKGSGTIMGSLALDYAFYSLNMMKVIGEVLSFNEISQQFHKKLGFVKKGLLQNNIIRNNEFIDVVRYEISKKQWEEQKKLLF